MYCSRYHKETHKEQLLVSDINRLLKSVLPNDAMAILGITWTDLYPTEDLNFVLGRLAFIEIYPFFHKLLLVISWFRTENSEMHCTTH